MFNILIIKHGSLGDIAQACGAIQDISENHPEDQMHILTTKPYFEILLGRVVSELDQILKFAFENKIFL